MRESSIDRQIAKVLKSAVSRRSIEAYQKIILHALPGPEPIRYHDERLDGPGDIVFVTSGMYALRRPSKLAK